MKEKQKNLVTGAVALVFAVLGYQTAMLVHYAALERITANRDHPDTVFVYAAPEDAGGGWSEGSRRREGGGGYSGSDRYREDGGGGSGSGGYRESGGSGYSGSGGSRGRGNGWRTERRNSQHDKVAQEIRRNVPPRRVESFRFNPNTVSVEDLMRLGFSAKQAQSIENYRNKGGRFRRPSDFGDSYVVADSVFRRLEQYIDIPLLDINQADSADFDALPGIGGWFANKMVEHRTKLRGYSCPQQLMEIYRFDQTRYDALKDLITCSAPEPYPLWTFPEDSLRQHPHIGRAARSIVFYRTHNPQSEWTLDGLLKAGVITPAQHEALTRCSIAPAR